MRILVTGANGFVGKAVCAQLLAQGHQVRAVVRQHFTKEQWLAINQAVQLDLAAFINDEAFQFCQIDAINEHTQWTAYLQNIDVVIHLAARVHIMQETADDPLTQYRHVNVIGTQHLANQAQQAGVKRFIYISSIKVNGEATQEQAFTENDRDNPQDPYGISKLEAEQALQDIALKSRMQYVIIRPSLVYGPGVKGNFFKLMQGVKRSLPLPLKGINNQRSMIFVTNLANLITATVTHPQAANQLFLAADDEALSSEQIIQQIARALEKPARLFNIPMPCLSIAAALTRKKGYLQRLTSSLVVSNHKAKQLLAWQPPVDMQQAIQQTVNWYCQEHQP
jgi:nucleoside-diphosphate-sugar epimerase